MANLLKLPWYVKEAANNLSFKLFVYTPPTPGGSLLACMANIRLGWKWKSWARVLQFAWEWECIAPAFGRGTWASDRPPPPVPTLLNGFSSSPTKRQNKLERLSREYLRGLYHCTIDLLFDLFCNKNKKLSVVIQLIPNQSNRRSTVQWYFPL